MDIDNNTNISSLISNSISKLNLNSTKTLKNQTKQVESREDKVDYKKEDTALIEDNKAINRINVKEIQQYAQNIGETLTIEDINYGLMYGRSVIADYCV